MKTILLILISIPLIFLGCSTPNTINCNDPNHIPVYVGVVSPGDFFGTWSQDTIIDSCIIAVTEGDSILKATITDFKTGNFITIKGGAIYGLDDPCGYRTRDFIDNDNARGNAFDETYFINNGNSIYFKLSISPPIIVRGDRR